MQAETIHPKNLFVQEEMQPAGNPICIYEKNCPAFIHVNVFYVLLSFNLCKTC